MLTAVRNVEARNLLLHNQKERIVFLLEEALESLQQLLRNFAAD